MTWGVTQSIFMKGLEGHDAETRYPTLDLLKRES